MKILHLMLSCFYIDNYSYQENMIPRFHKEAGHEVEIVASLFTFDENGKDAWLEGPCKYVNEHGIPVTRLNFKAGPLSRRLKVYDGFAAELERIQPELIFIHGVQFCDVSVVIKYLKKHPGVKVYVDNHADFTNSATNFVSKYLLHGVIWKACARRINPYVKKFYGVLPCRVDFLTDFYGLPRDKTELLVMGADDDLVAGAAQADSRADIRSRYGISEDDFLIMTGGKIDLFKTQTLLLMDAVNAIGNPKVKLIVFGSVVPELKEEVAKRCSDRVQYIGWVLAKESYRYFAAADLVVFPGRHSVFWEQVAAQGVPMLCKRLPGTDHVDLGGNVRFLEKDSAEEIREIIETLIENPGQYQEMKRVAMEKGMETFSYRSISRRAIEQDAR